MKTNADDMLHKLATGEDKLEKIKRTKERLAHHGYKCKVARRKMAKGTKTYFTIVSAYTDDNLFVNTHQSAIRSILYKEFPKAIMTSGGGSSLTFAEY